MINRYHNSSLILFLATYVLMPFFCFSGHVILVILIIVFWFSACLYALFAKQQSAWWSVLAFFIPFGILPLLFIQDRARDDSDDRRDSSSVWRGIRYVLGELIFMVLVLGVALIVNSMYFTYIRHHFSTEHIGDGFMLGLELTGLFVLVGLSYQMRTRVRSSVRTV